MSCRRPSCETSRAGHSFSLLIRLNAQADSRGNVYLEQHLTPTEQSGRNGGQDPQAKFNSFIGCQPLNPVDEDIILTLLPRS